MGHVLIIGRGNCLGRFVYSGGSRWLNVMDRVQGIEVPDHQTQGDLWGKLLHEINFGGYIPEYLYVALTSNDLDKINDQFFHQLRRSNVWHLLSHCDHGPSDFYKRNNNLWFDDRIPPPRKIIDFNNEEFIRRKLLTLLGEIDSVMKVLHFNFGYCKKYMLGVIPRANWFPAVVNMLPDINKHMRSKHKMTICQMNAFIIRKKHIDKDGIHFSHEGYKLFASKGMNSMLDSHYNRYKKPKPDKIPLEQKSKSCRKRIYRKIRNANASAGKYQFKP